MNPSGQLRSPYLQNLYIHTLAQHIRAYMEDSERSAGITDTACTAKAVGRAVDGMWLRQSAAYCLFLQPDLHMQSILTLWTVPFNNVI